MRKSTCRRRVPIYPAMPPSIARESTIVKFSHLNNRNLIRESAAAPIPPTPGPGRWSIEPAGSRRSLTRRPRLINPHAPAVPPGLVTPVPAAPPAPPAGRAAGLTRWIRPMRWIGTPRGYRIHHVSHIHHLSAPGRHLRNRPRHSRPASTAPADRRPSIAGRQSPAVNRRPSPAGSRGSSRPR